MATTKIWGIKGRLDILINYAANSDKTDGLKFTTEEIQSLHDVIDYAVNEYKTEKRLYVSGVNVTPDNARDKMIQTKMQFNKLDGITAFHAIQSFKPSEVTAELAHDIGVQLAEKLWGERFEVVVATHLNKSHIHNHFVINSVSFVDGKRYYDNKETYRQMRSLSDKLCLENGLSIITNPQNKGKHYAEWKAEKDGFPTIRGQIRQEMDEIIKSSYTYKMFLLNLKKRGYELKTGMNVKYPSVKPAYSKRFVRLKSLGENYTEDAIKERIIMARHGMKQIDTPTKDYNDWTKKYEHKKLTGFKALYFHYLYLFGKIRKKETPQRVSFFMREELTKLKQYQKQFMFLYDNNIETVVQLKNLKTNCQSEIDELIVQRKDMQKSKNTSQEQITEINEKLKLLRYNVRMCDNILSDVERISEKFNHEVQLEQEAEKQTKHSHEYYR